MELLLVTTVSITKAVTLETRVVLMEAAVIEPEETVMVIVADPTISTQDIVDLSSRAVEEAAEEVVVVGGDRHQT